MVSRESASSSQGTHIEHDSACGGSRYWSLYMGSEGGGHWLVGRESASQKAAAVLSVRC